MEPVTHVLTGACLARTGLNRRAAYATAAMAVAAEFPDIDTLWGVRGPLASFQHHRGITHTFVGLPFEAAFLVLLFFVIHRVRERRLLGRTPGTANPGFNLVRAPVRWGVLYGFVLLALLSHLLLDFTNNYGLRPFLPFDTRWYAASIVFIFDPLIFLLLVGGLVLPSLFGLVAREVGTRRKSFQGAGWARAALLGVVCLWGVRSYEHQQAMTLANAQTLQAPAPEPEPADPTANVSAEAPPQERAEITRPFLAARRSVVSPDPFNIFRWYTATDFGPAYRLGTANTRDGTLFPGQVLTKPVPTPMLNAAQNSHLGQVYQDWSSMPWLTVSTPDPQDDRLPPTARTMVLFEDLRFMGSNALLHRRGTTPLTGEVVLDQNGKVLEQGLDGRFRP